MNRKEKADTCLTDREIAILAIQIITREGAAGGDPLKGSMDHIPESLFPVLDDSIAAGHLSGCGKCLERLRQEVIYLRSHTEALDRSEPGEVKEALIREWEKNDRVRVLRPDLPSAAGRSGLSLAASTTVAGREPMRFSTPAGDLIIKEIGSEESGEHALLIIGDSRFVSGAEVIIHGESYFSDEEGYIRFAEDMPRFGRDDLILVAYSGESS